MFNFHPALSALPIGVLLTWWIVSFFKGISFRFQLLLAALSCSAVLSAFFSGYQANVLLSEAQLEGHGDAIGLHHLLGRFVLVCAFLSALLLWVSERATHSRLFFRALFLFMLTVSLLLVAVTSHHGGDLVFGRGLGVEKQLESSYGSSRSDLSNRPADFQRVP